MKLESLSQSELLELIEQAIKFNSRFLFNGIPINDKIKNIILNIWRAE